MNGDEGALPKNREAAWLTSGETWGTSLGKGWRGTKILGRGAFGVAGLWECFDIPAPALREIVVKQTVLPANTEGADEAMNEGKMLSLLAPFMSRHILRMYGPIRRGNFEKRKVLRLFLEYCPGGDLNSFVESDSANSGGGYDEGEDYVNSSSGEDGEYGSEDDGDYEEQVTEHTAGIRSKMGAGALEKATCSPTVQISISPDSSVNREGHSALLEVDIWAMFYCLALGVCVMDHGSEDDTVDPRLEGQIAHNDIKLDNVFLGYRNADHKRYPILKIADFGDAFLVPPEKQVDDPLNDDRGHVDWQPPEQHYILPKLREQWTLLEHPRKGTCSNVFQVGCIMHSLITRKKKQYSKPEKHVSSFNENLLRGYTHGTDMESKKCQIYSRSLRELVMECMMRESLLRPTARELRIRAFHGLNQALKAASSEDYWGDKGMEDVPYMEVEPDVPSELLLPDPLSDSEDEEPSTDGEEASDLPGEDDDRENGHERRKRELDGGLDREREAQHSKRRKTFGNSDRAGSDSSGLSDVPESDDDE